MKYFLKIFIVTFLLFFGYIANASVVSFDLGKTQILEGGLSKISIYLDTSGELVNTIEGDLVYNDKLIKIEKIEIGDSIINLWVDQPNADSVGRVHFSGIIPGGLSIAKGNIFSIIVRGQSVGIAGIDLENVNLFLNDGEGSMDEVSVNSAEITIIENSTGEIEPLNINDQAPPEEFKVVRTRDLSLYDNKWFVVFSTQDKGVGVDYYRVCESFGQDCVEASSPYLLQHQNPFYYIKVTAYDAEGNTQDALLISNWIIFVIVLLIFCILGFLLYLYYRYFKNYKV